MRGAVVLRPEPGNAATAAQLGALGIDVMRQPLFAVAPVAWRAPSPAALDALLLTSANAVRHAGDEIRKVAELPVLAVGAATAAAARAHGLTVALTGERDVAALVAAGSARGFERLLHLAGRDRVEAHGVEAVTVYRSEPMRLPAGAACRWERRVALLHSARAASRFAELVQLDGADRAGIAVAVLSPAVLEAAGEDWAAAAVAERPTDAALVAAAAALIDPSGDGVDKRGR